MWRDIRDVAFSTKWEEMPNGPDERNINMSDDVIHNPPPPDEIPTDQITPKPIKDIKMLSQPLMTEEGFINPACMNELESTINSMGTTHERLANDDEWNKKGWIFRKEIVGYLAAWAIRQSPRGVPEGLETVCKYLDACLKKSVEWIHEGMADLTLCEISRLLHDILMDKGIKAFDNWNRSQADREGVHKDPEIAFSCRYSKDDAFYDFIDLSALLHNVCISIRDEWRANQAFDAKFEAKYGKLGADDL